jgi:hypothetical protein
MPHALAIALGAAFVFYALRWVRREYDRVETSLRRMDRRIRRPAPAVAPLMFDALEGFYRPAE